MLKTNTTVSLISITSPEVPTAGFELFLSRRWSKYIFLYFLPSGKLFGTESNFTLILKKVLLLPCPPWVSSSPQLRIQHVADFSSQHCLWVFSSILEFIEVFQGASEHVQLGPLFNSFRLVRTNCPCRLDFHLHSLCFHCSSPLCCHPCRHERTQEEDWVKLKEIPW